MLTREVPELEQRQTMSKFFSDKYRNLVPYTPGEQPKDTKYIKLNTNESPFPPSPKTVQAASEQAAKCELYSDPTCSMLCERASEYYGVEKENIIFTNGSDEVLNFAFMAFSDAHHPLAFADITYGFYSVFAELNNIPYRKIKLNESLEINCEDYKSTSENIVIANPNAPTGIALPLSEIEKIVKSNSERIVIIDEAYVDFGGESAVPLTKKYKNLLVVQTFSKSRSLAGARLGIGIGDSELIADLNTIKYSTNPYNINRMSAAAGYAALGDDEYYKENVRQIIENRQYLTKELCALGFACTDSRANFVFAKSTKIGGEELYLSLKKKGILIRHFDGERIRNYNRITVGTRKQCEALISAIAEILKEKQS